MQALFKKCYSLRTRSWHKSFRNLLPCTEQDPRCMMHDRMLNEVKRMIIFLSPERRLLDFESTAMNAFRPSFPNATVTGCYFHLS